MSVDYDKAVNFIQLKNYKLLPKSEKSTEDTRLDSPLVDKRIVAAIEQNLFRKGFSKQESSPDILVKYQVDMKQEIESDRSGVSMLFGAGTRSSGIGIAYSLPTSDVKSYERGVLTIDFISAKTNQLVVAWHQQSLSLRPGVAGTLEWRATIQSPDTPWVAVVVPNSDLSRRMELTGAPWEP